MNDEIIDYLREHSDGVSSTEITGLFFKFKNADPRLAHTTVNAILGRDKRCAFGEDQLWHAHKEATKARTLASIDWAPVFIVMDPDRTRKRILYISVWKVFPEISCQFSTWLIDPSEIPFEERDRLTGDLEGPTEFIALEPSLSRIVQLLESSVPVFMTASHYTQLFTMCAVSGLFLTDDMTSVSELLRAADLPVPKPLTTESLSRIILSQERTELPVHKQAQIYTECLQSLFQSIRERGIESREDLDKCDERMIRPQFVGKQFSYEQIFAATEHAGVYAFKNSKQEYLYIGKAKNLKRRLLTYFRDTEESPQKLIKLRSEADSLVTHACGSELESLVLEYRLIKKHSPLLNKKVEIGERKGTFSPITDCIALLPHTDQTKGMSFWFRQNQKTLMRPFSVSFSDADQLLDDINTFFFTEKLASETSDFPEQEIVFRWLKANQDHSIVVPVSRLANAQEIFDAMKSYWKDVRK